MENEDTTPKPRNPPKRSFASLSENGIRLDADLYSSCIAGQPRLDAYDYNEEKNSPRWKDEDLFYRWLLDAQIPRELAVMLYNHCPEVSFLLWPGHVSGVETVISDNSITEVSRQAGYFILASGPNGDPVAIDLLASDLGQVGFLPHDQLWSSSATELRQLFIPVCKSIGLFFYDFKDWDNRTLPSDYYAAKERQK